MTKAEIIEYLYDNNVRADITIEQMADDLTDHKTKPQIYDFFRNPTVEERKAVADYIDSISVPTGVNVFDLMDEPQTDIHDLTDCDFCKDRNCKDCEGGKDEPQTDYTPDCPFCVRYGTDECLRDKCRHYQTYKDEPQTGQPCDGCEYSKPYIEYKCTHLSCKFEDESQIDCPKSCPFIDICTKSDADCIWRGSGV